MFWPTSLAGMFVVTILRTIATGPIMAVIFAMMADVVEWTQWKYHVREEGMVFAASGILFKAISAITTAILGFALDAAGYVESTGVLVKQPQAVLDLIPKLYHWGLVIIYVLMLLVLSHRRSFHPAHKTSDNHGVHSAVFPLHHIVCSPKRKTN